jgi:hypothetical protein
MIRVLWGYRGVPSNERYIEAGEYDEKNKRLFGLADYLVKNGHAVAVESDDRGETEAKKKEAKKPVEEIAPVARPKTTRRRSKSI